MDLGTWTQERESGTWIQDHGFRKMDSGIWIQ